MPGKDNLHRLACPVVTMRRMAAARRGMSIDQLETSGHRGYHPRKPANPELEPLRGGSRLAGRPIETGEENAMKPAKKATQKSRKSTTATAKKPKGFTDEE